MKTIVTHTNPDFDAVASVWLIQKYLPGWDTASVVFVPAGTTLKDKDPDGDPNVIHVDTGFGKFDHHQTAERTCAAELVLNDLTVKGQIKEKDYQAMVRLVTLIKDDDHFADPYFPDPTADRYLLLPFSLIKGLKSTLGDDQHVYIIGSTILDAALRVFQNIIKAEHEIKKGFVFNSFAGKSIAMETGNEETMKLALKSGFSLVVRKDPAGGNVRIKTLPDESLDLTPLYNLVKQEDKKGTWFLHASRHMLLNGSKNNPRFIPTPLTLPKIIEIVKKL